MTDNANVKQERVSITAFISKDTRDKLLRIAEDEDLTFSALVRRALKEYADKKAIKFKRRHKMNNQTKTQENVKKALAKQTLGLPLTPHEHALVTLYGQSPVQQKENKPEFVEKYLKPLIVALGVGVVNVVYRKTSEHDEIVTLIYENGFTTDKDVSADSLSALTCDTIKGL